MANCSQNKNPLKRNGTSQKQRQLPGLLPDYVQIDERSYSDWIVFATQFAKYLNYYDTSTGALSGNWQPFFTSDISALYGAIAIQNIEIYRTYIKERIDYIKNNDHAGNENTLKVNLTELFNAVFTLAKSLDNYYLQFADNNSFKTVLQQIIKLKLAPAIHRMAGYYKGADEMHLLRNSEATDWKVLNLAVGSAEELMKEGLSSAWWTSSITSFSDIDKNDSIYGLGIPEKEGGEVDEEIVFHQVSHAANHHLFASAIDLFTGSYARIITEAEKYLLQTLESFDSHVPHYALFLTFLKLFKNSQSNINSLTWRHLDYYYKEILGLKPKDAIPNTVHLIAELAKQQEGVALKAGTLFKAGKDSSGKEVLYALDAETTFNKASVALFRAMYKGAADGDDDIEDGVGNITANNKGRVFAAPVINSGDSVGGKLTSENGEWHPMFNKIYGEEGEVTAVNMQPAEIGFAVASHYLFLAEGKRTIQLRFDASGTSITKEQLVCYVTTEKEWYSVSPTEIKSVTFEGSAENCLEIVINIPEIAPAITAYSTKVHGGSYNVDVPVLKCVLKNEDGTDAYAYETVKNITISKTEIKVTAGDLTSATNANGLKQLTMSNLNGPIDASKPFMPFGAAPEIGTSLLIGNKEMFSKKNASFVLNTEWGNWTSTSGTKPTIGVQFLEGGTWKSATGTLTGTSITDNNKQLLLTSLPKIPDNALVNYKDDYSNYSTDTRSGFMKIVLNDDFGHSSYLNDLTVKLINAAKKTGTATTADIAVTVPYTPLMNSLYVGYTAYSGAVTLDSTTSNEDTPLSFFHVGSFGEAKRDGYLTGDRAHLVLHQDEFPLSDKSGDSFSADWYIGIENLAGDQSVNILFQLLEGSTDPLVSKPEEHVHWSYLSNNLWIEFDEREVNDATQQLVKSGIISFTIPGDATTDNTILPTGYLWLKASVAEAPDAICKILSVHAQAMSVTYSPQNNAADFLDNTLPAGTIAKLKEPNSAFKKIQQPYSSFGGRQAESSTHFYLRSSERLRHKGRAITIWDYERMVLEAFPELHKVKCLNHTQIEDGVNAIYNETKPGHVAIVTIPNVINRNEVNPLKPYTNQNLLSDIKSFLEERISEHVKVNVCNPLFEEVRLEFKLQLREEYDDFTYYSKLLKDEITQYLAPWAYKQQVEIQFGGKINRSQLIDFIEERYYVDFITDVRMLHKPDSNAAELTTNFEEITATSARSVLVSAAASKHDIDPYQ
jgi:hypothetical protein